MSGVELKNFRPKDEAPPAYGVYENAGYSDTDGVNHVKVAATDLERGPGAGHQNVGYIENEAQSDSLRNRYSGDSDSLPPKVHANGDVIPADYLEEEVVFEDEDPGELNACMRCVAQAQEGMTNFFVKNKKILKWLFIGLLLLLYFAYFAYAMYYRFGDEGSIRLLWVTCVTVFCIIIYIISRYQGDRIREACRPCTSAISKHSFVISWVVVLLIFVAVIIFVIVDQVHITKKPYNLISLSGIVLYVLLLFIFSHNPARVKWRPVAWGLALQFVLALLILRTVPGLVAFEWLGDRVTEFLAYTNAGSSFVFGAGTYTHHYFAFAVLPIIIFFSTAISVLYYLGVMQVVIRKISWIMQATMGTTAGESLNAAGNIFIGQTEAPLLIRPLLHRMTRSELHAVMTGGFATIAGSVLGAYIGMGVPAKHLLSASVMSAPAALAMSKLFYPETQKSHTTAEDVKKMEKPPEKSMIAAASAGASAAIKLVANIAANLIAFLAVLAFINATLTWFGMRVGLEPPNYQYLTFEFICSYVLFPFALVMGVELEHCRQVAQLVGVKTFLNEFIAYERFGKIVENTKTFNDYVNNYSGNYSYKFDDIILHEYPFNNTVLEGGVMSDRSQVITTYALCGFANLGSIGVMLGGLGALAPRRKQDLARIVVRAMIAGNVACFMTACIAGLFYQ